MRGWQLQAPGVETGIKRKVRSAARLNQLDPSLSLRDLVDEEPAVDVPQLLTELPGAAHVPQRLDLSAQVSDVRRRAPRLTATLLRTVDLAVGAIVHDESA